MYQEDTDLRKRHWIEPMANFYGISNTIDPTFFWPEKLLARSPSLFLNMPFMNSETNSSLTSSTYTAAAPIESAKIEFLFHLVQGNLAGNSCIPWIRKALTSVLSDAHSRRYGYRPRLRYQSIPHRRPSSLWPIFEVLVTDIRHQHRRSQWFQTHLKLLD